MRGPCVLPWLAQRNSNRASRHGDGNKNSRKERSAADGALKEFEENVKTDVLKKWGIQRSNSGGHDLLTKSWWCG